MKSFATISFAVLSLFAAVQAASPPTPATSVPVATQSAPYPSSTVKGASQIVDGQIQATGAPKPASTVKGVSQIADGQIQATGAAKPSSGIAKPTTAPPKPVNSTIPFTGAGNQIAVAPVGGLMIALAAAVAAL